MNGINLQNVYEKWASNGKFLQTLTNSAPFTALFESVGKYRQYAVAAAPMYTDIVTTLLRLDTESGVESEHLALSTDAYDVGDASLFDLINDTVRLYGSEITSGEFAGDYAIQATVTGGYAIHIRVDDSGAYLDLFQGDSGEPIATRVLLDFMVKDGVTYTRLYKKPMASAGYEFTYEDLIRDFIAQTELLKYVDVIAQSAMSGSLSLAWLQQLRGRVSEVYADVREYVDRVLNAYAAGGFKSALAAILGWAKSAASVSTDEDGLLAFTDNSSLAPETYLVGFLSQIMQGITAVASVIASIFSRVLGAVLSVLGSVLWGIIGSIAGDYSQRSMAGMNPSDKAFIGWSPLACARIEGWINADGEVAATILSQGLCVMTLPFGYLLCGLASIPAEGASQLHVRVEFHPSIMDCGLAANAVANQFATFTPHQHTVADPNYYVLMTINNATSLYASSVLSVLEQQLELYPPLDPELHNSGTTGVLSEADDMKLRRIIAQNLGMGQLLLFTIAANQLGFMSVCKAYKIELGSTSTTCKWERDLSQSVVADWTPFNTALVYMFFGPAYGYAFPGTSYKIGAPSWAAMATDTMLQDTRTIGAASDLKKLLSTGGSRSDYTHAYVADFAGSLLSVPSGTEFIHSIPQYDAASWFAVVGITLAITLVTATVVAAVSVGVKKAFREYNAKSSAQVEKAWTALTNNPTAENAKAYNKIAFKHNLIARLTGGTTYDRSNYWGGGGGSTPVVDGQSLLSSVAKADQCDTAALTLSDIYYSITGI